MNEWVSCVVYPNALCGYHPNHTICIDSINIIIIIIMHLTLTLFKQQFHNLGRVLKFMTRKNSNVVRTGQSMGMCKTKYL
jgi:hypothetical protein